jgi:hypothetical protein
MILNAGESGKDSPARHSRFRLWLTFLYQIRLQVTC